jgi:hypothetical protein
VNCELRRALIRLHFCQFCDSEVETHDIRFRKESSSPCLSWASPPVLPSSLSSQLRRLDSLTSLEWRERERLTLSTLQTLPKAESLLVIPNQRTNIRLHIPVQRKRCVLALRDLALHVCDLVLGLLGVKLDDAWAATSGVWFSGCFFGFFALCFGRFRGRVDVGVWVGRRVVGGDDSVPDHELGVRDGGGRGRWVGGGDIDEDLLGIPVKEGGQVYMLGSALLIALAWVMSQYVPASRSNLTWAYSSLFVL